MILPFLPLLSRGSRDPIALPKLLPPLKALGEPKSFALSAFCDEAPKPKNWADTNDMHILRARHIVVCENIV